MALIFSYLFVSPVSDLTDYFTSPKTLAIPPCYQFTALKAQQTAVFSKIALKEIQFGSKQQV